MSNIKPKPIKSEDVAPTLARLRGGCVDARDEIINGHMRLVLAVANQFTKKFPRLKEGIESKTLEILVDRCEKIRLGESDFNHDNIAGYLNTCVKMRLRDYTKLEVKLYNSKNFSSTIPDQSVSSDLNLLIWELKNDPRLTESERTLILMRMEGYTDKEIGEKIGATQQKVGLVRKTTLAEKLEDYLNDF